MWRRSSTPTLTSGWATSPPSQRIPFQAFARLLKSARRDGRQRGLAESALAQRGMDVARVRTTHHSIVGGVRWRPLEGGRIDIFDGWVEKNVVTVGVSQLKGASVSGKPSTGKGLFFKAAAAQLQPAWEELEEHRLLHRVLTWDRSFVPRLIRGSTTKPSNHAFGTAFDINARWNGPRVTPPARRD